MPHAYSAPEFSLFHPLESDRSIVTPTIEKLASVWRAAVRETHDFLSSEDFSEIDHIVSYVYLPHTPVWIVTSPNNDDICGFMGLTEADNGHMHIDTLFLHPHYIGVGLGRRFIAHACDVARKNAVDALVSVDVNEQNTKAVAFYKHMGFCVTRRDDKDADGRPYPILHMSLALS